MLFFRRSRLAPSKLQKYMYVLCTSVSFVTLLYENILVEHFFMYFTQSWDIFRNVLSMEMIIFTVFIFGVSYRLPFFITTVIFYKKIFDFFWFFF